VKVIDGDRQSLRWSDQPDAKTSCLLKNRWSKSQRTEKKLT